VVQVGDRRVIIVSLGRASAEFPYQKLFTHENTMSTTYSMQNGVAKRKQLSDELDRLDTLIDGLAQNLNAAVADAVKGGAREAVQEVLGELFANPDIAKQVRPAGMSEKSVTDTCVPGVWTRVKAAAAAVVVAVGRTAKKAFGAVASVARMAAAKVKAKVASAKAKVVVVRRVLAATWQVKRILVIALSVGVAAASVSALDHTVASVLSGAGAAVTAVTVQLGLWWRKLARDWTAV
jgi:hypothetical protein